MRRTVSGMDANTRKLLVTKASRTRFYGPEDPRTIDAARALLQARIDAAEAEAARLRALLAAMPGAVPA